MKLSVGFFISAFGMGGAEKFILKLISNNLWELKKIEVSMILNHSSGESISELKKILPRNIKFYVLSSDLSLKHPIRSAKLIHRAIKELHLTHIFSLMSGMTRNLLLYKLLTFNKVKVISLERNNPKGLYYENILMKWYLHLEFFILYKFIFLAVSNSKGLRDYYKKFTLNGRSKVINNPVDCKNILHKSEEKIPKGLERVTSNKFFLNIGRLEPQKNQELLIDQFSIFIKNSDINDINLLIIGSGTLKDKLKKKIDNLNLNSRIFILDYIENPYPFIKLCHGFVLTSHWEGMPNVLLESVALRRPIISIDCDFGPKEIADFYQIKLIKHHESHKLHEAMNDVYMDESTQCKNTINYLQENYSLNKVCNEYISLIEKS